MTRFPWAVSVEVDPFGGESDIYVGSPDRREELKDYSLRHSRADAARVYSRDDADLIVRAVNLHDELVGALRSAERAVKMTVKCLLGNGPTPDPDTMADATNAIHAVLAKVEAQS